MVDERRADLSASLARERKPDAVLLHDDVAFEQRRDPVRARRLRVTIVADPEPAEIDETQRDRAYALSVELRPVEVRRRRLAQLGQPLTESDQPVELLVLLLGAVVRVVAVLLSARLVEPRGLQFRARTSRDPDVGP